MSSDSEYAVLVADADETLREFLCAQLTLAGFETFDAASPERVYARLRDGHFDALLIGEFASRPAAIELVRHVRDGNVVDGVNPAVPFLVLSGDASEMALVRSFHAGADAHIVKPASCLEIELRLRAVLRRANLRALLRHRQIGALHIDLGAREVHIGDQRVGLSRLEFDLLCALAEDPERVFTKAELAQAVWGYQAPPRTRNVEDQARRLRTKLRAHGGDYVTNVWGVGYRLVNPSDSRDLVA